MGAGLCVALSCDLRIISKSAKVGLNFVKIGISPGMFGICSLAECVGIQKATQLIMTGEMIDGEEACKIGLALKCEDTDNVIGKAVEIAQKISESSPIAVKASVKLLRKRMNEQMEQVLEEEASNQADCYAAGDLAEGISSIEEKKKAIFKDHTQ